MSDMVPSPPGDVHRKSHPSSSRGKSLTKSKRGAPPAPKRPRGSPIGGLENIKQQLQTEGVSDKAIHLICSKRSKSTQYNYNRCWAQFSSWVTERGADPFRCNLPTILNYLSSLYEKGFSYRYINSHRSAISGFHTKIDYEGTPTDVGKHPRVCDLLGGISKERPPKPKYFDTWDICKVLDHFKSKGPNELLSLKELSHKLVMLLAITSFHRGAELHLLSSNTMNVFVDRTEFLLEGNLKTTKRGKTNKPSIFYKFRRDPRLCPQTCIESYLARTLPLRKASTQGPIFLSFMKPHNPVGRDTLRRWIVATIATCGIDSVFKAHSTRSAASSKALKAGIPIPDILAKGNWSNVSTFQKFYCKPIRSNPTKNLQKGILSTLN